MNTKQISELYLLSGHSYDQLLDQETTGSGNDSRPGIVRAMMKLTSAGLAIATGAYVAFIALASVLSL